MKSFCCLSLSLLLFIFFFGMKKCLSRLDYGKPYRNQDLGFRIAVLSDILNRLFLTVILEKGSWTLTFNSHLFLWFCFCYTCLASHKVMFFKNSLFSMSVSLFCQFFMSICFTIFASYLDCSCDRASAADLII